MHEYINTKVILNFWKSSESDICQNLNCNICAPFNNESNHFENRWPCYEIIDYITRDRPLCSDKFFIIDTNHTTAAASIYSFLLYASRSSATSFHAQSISFFFSFPAPRPHVFMFTEQVRGRISHLTSHRHLRNRLDILPFDLLIMWPVVTDITSS